MLDKKHLRLFRAITVRLIAVLLGLGLFSNLSIGQTTTGSGNWSSATNPPWPGGTVPAVTGAVVISNTHILTLTAAVTQTSGTLTLNGNGSLQMAGFNFTAGTLTAAGAAVINNAGVARTLSVGANNTNSTYTGTITNNIALTKTGTGTLTFSGNNNYNGVTNVNAGTLQVTNANGLGGIGAGTTVTSGATLDLNNVSIGAENITNISGTGVSASSGALSVSSGTSALTGAITMTGATTIGGNGTQLTLSGAIGGAFALTKQGSSTLILSNTGNNYGGATTITDGTLKLGASGVIPDASAVSVANGENFDLAGFNETVGSIAGAGNIISSAGTPTLISGGDNSNTIVSGAIQNAIALTKTGTGTLTLSGNNSYTGATVVNSGGALSLASGNALGNTSSTTVNSGGELNIVGGINISKNINIAGTGVSSAGALTGTGAGTSTMSGTVTMTAASSMGGSGTLTVSGVVSGAFNLTKVGSGTLTLSSNSNSYSGNTTVSEGTLRLGANNAIPSTSSMNLSGSSVFDMNGNSATITSLTGSSTSSIIGSGTLTINTSSNTTMAGALQGTFNMVKTGTGTLTLTGTNTNTGTLTITQGVVALGASLPSKVILNGGVLNGGSSNVTLGAFATQNSGNSNFFTSNSEINLSTGNITFTSAESVAGGNWNNSFLKINGWTGSFNGTTGSGGKIFIGGSALTANQLRLIRFYNSVTGFYHTANQLVTGEVVPNTLASGSPASCSAGVTLESSLTIPACNTLFSLASTVGPGALINDREYSLNTANCGTSSLVAGNITGGNSNTKIYVRSGETLTIGDYSGLNTTIYVLSGGTLNVTGNLTNSGSIYVYGTMVWNKSTNDPQMNTGNTIYIASTGSVDIRGTMALNNGSIVNEGSLKINNTANWSSSVICQLNNGCTNLLAQNGLTNPNANVSANNGVLYWPNATCPGPTNTTVSNGNSFTMDPNMKVCTGQTNPSNLPTSTHCAYWGAAKVFWGCVPPSGTCSGAIALPITLTFFKPTLTNEGVIVKWGTNSQWDSDYFIIEKSKNGIDWEYVSTLPSENGKYRYKEFSVTDPNPYEGDSYYRLVEVDKDGKRTVYATDFVHNDKIFAGFSIYPNPSNGSFIVAISGDSPQYQMALFDVLGKNLGLYTLFAGKNEINTALASGIYLAKLKVGQDYYTQTIVVQ